MLIKETTGVALNALRVNKLRSLLTMLGIVIGVGAVIAMVALGRGAQNSVNARIAALGTTLLTITPGQVSFGGVASATNRARLTTDDADALEAQGRWITAVEPEMGRSLQVQYRNGNTNTTVLGHVVQLSRRPQIFDGCRSDVRRARRGRTAPASRSSASRCSRTWEWGMRSLVRKCGSTKSRSR